VYDSVVSTVQGSTLSTEGPKHQSNNGKTQVSNVVAQETDEWGHRTNDRRR
jgi:hypothetical protein